MTAYSLPEGLKYVQVKFMDDDGVISERRPGRPVVKVVLRYDPNHHSGPFAPQNFVARYALLDTGADNNYGTEETIGNAQCPQIGTSVTHGSTSSIESTHHRCHLYFPEAAVQIETDIFSAPLRNSPATEHLIIGMLAIECGVLIMDFKRDIYRLYLG